MTIKQQGGIFGRNPTFNDVTVEGSLAVDGTLTVGGEVLSGLDFEGAWDATSGAPSASPSTGQFWIVSVAGTTSLSGITNWGIGDWALYDGTNWQRIEGGADGNFNQLTSSSTTVLNGTTIPASKTLVVTTDIGSTVEAYDATILKSADIGSTVEAYDATILKSANIGSTVQGYDADTAKYDDTIANFTGTLQEGGNNVVTANEVGTIASQDANSVNIDGGAIDGAVLGTSSPITEAQIDNININANTISSTNTNGNVVITPDGTGELFLTKAGNAFIHLKNTQFSSGQTKSGVKLYGNNVFRSALQYDDANGTTSLDTSLGTNQALLLKSGGGFILTATGGTINVSSSNLAFTSGNGINFTSGGKITSKTGQVTAGGSTTVNLTTLATSATNQVYMLTVRQSGLGGNSVMGYVTAYNTSVGVVRVAQSNTNPVLDLALSASGATLRLTTGSGFGTTTWDWLLTQLK